VSGKSTSRTGDSARERLIRALLQSSFDQGPEALTLAEAARRGGLSRPSVVTVREQLRPVLDLGSGGASSQTISLAPHEGLAVGVEVRQDEFTILLTDLVGAPLGEPCQETKALEEDPRTTLDRAAALIERCLNEAGRDSEEIVGLGLSLAHPVDPRHSGMVRALNMTEDRAWHLWEGLGDVRQQLRQRLRWSGPRAPQLKDFIADNDANFSAFGESRWGALRGTQHALYLHWADGIGSGLIVRGEIDPGVGGVAGAIGHMSVSDGPAVRCPRCGLSGCLETSASGRAILSSLGREYGSATVEELVAEAADRDSDAFASLQAGAFQLGRVLGTCLHVLNPEAIVIGGTFGHSVFDLVRNEGLEEGLRHQAVPSALDDVNVGGVHQSRFRDHTAVRGAITRVLWELLPGYLARKADGLA
jgi:predicted NBD/HSP70 family sugar kinase